MSTKVLLYVVVFSLVGFVITVQCYLFNWNGSLNERISYQKYTILRNCLRYKQNKIGQVKIDYCEHEDYWSLYSYVD